MPQIKLISLTFDEHKFRKLTNMVLEIAPRITLIAGHNGIGKSTILALIAHPSGLTSRDHVSYFDNTFQANFNDIIHLDYEADYAAKLPAGAASSVDGADTDGGEKTLSEPEVAYLINGDEIAAKACRLGPRPGPSSAKGVRVVARSVLPTTREFTSKDGSITIGSDGKVPLPTIYLGMTRVLPVGEAQKGTATSSAYEMDPLDAQFVADFFNQIIPGSAVGPSVTSQRIKNTKKVSGQPDHGFDARCVSLGQDSLGSIAMALASFQMLKRTWPEYPGGLLIIDEIDSGLHPHAIGSLVEALKKAARNLDLQIIATTHSPKLIEAVHPESEPKNPKPLDKVIYIRDRAHPSLMENATLRRILDDMSLVPPEPPKAPPLPSLKVYFEDDEAAAFFHALIPKRELNKIGAKYGVKISPLPMGLGCEHLAKLSAHDPYFKNVAIVLDADAAMSGKAGKDGNTVKLPGDRYSAALTGSENPDIVTKPLAPERTLLQYILGIANHPEANEATLIRLHAKDVTTEHLLAHMLDGETTVLSKREQTKGWWKSKLTHIQNWELIEEWVADRPAEVKKFRADFETVISTVSARLKP